MSSYFRKYAKAISSARTFVSQWSSERVFAVQPLIVPFPTLAVFDPHENIWSIQIKAWVYFPFQNKSLKNSLPSTTDARPTSLTNSQAIECINQDQSLQETPPEDFNESARLTMFFVENSCRISTKTIINGVEYSLEPSDENGFIEQYLEFPDREIDSFCPKIYSSLMNDRQFDYEIQLNERRKSEAQDDNQGSVRSFKSTIYLPAPIGLSVVSDIDDTIKVSNVSSKHLLLKHTFYNCFKPVEGMSELYNQWRAQNCQFHYVSASPWQLYPALRCFLEKYRFPLGTVNLRKFSWTLKFFTPDENFKLETISNFIEAYPTRRFIFVGDSGQCDPEIYGKLYRKYPQSVLHILIRDICSLIDSEQRYAQAFQNIPKQRWTVFKDAREISDEIHRLH